MYSLLDYAREVILKHVIFLERLFGKGFAFLRLLLLDRFFLFRLFFQRHNLKVFELARLRQPPCTVYHNAYDNYIGNQEEPEDYDDNTGKRSVKQVSYKEELYI